jgi:L-asparagine transporter-like permease
VILITHLRFRRAIAPDLLHKLPLKLPAHPWPTLAAMLALFATAISTFWVDGLQYTNLTFLPLLGIMSVIYFVYKSKMK